MCESSERKYLVVGPVGMREQMPSIHRAATFTHKVVLWRCTIRQPWFSYITINLEAGSLQQLSYSAVKN